MSYPNYPGYPAQGSGYYPPSYPPQQQQSQYPGYPPQPGFVNSTQQPGYPNSTGSYPPAPNSTPYPVNPTYPTNPTNPTYPASNTGYPGSNAGYPASNLSYPGSNPSYPATNPSYPTTNPGYPGAISGYPGASSGYPASNPAYPVAPGGYPSPNPISSYPAAPGPVQGPGFPGQSFGGASTLYPSQASFSHSASTFPGIQSHTTAMESKIPTVHPASPFDPRTDADHLHKAMKGLGTDEAALINILCRRTSIQRMQIAMAYKSSYGKDLTSKLKSELSGNLERVMVALAMPMAEYLAKELHDSVDGLGTNEGTLVEVLCSRSNHEIHEINAAYQRLYNHPLEKDIKGDTSGEFKRILIALLQGNRDDNPVVNVALARDDAQRLYRAGEGKLGTDESTFIAILASRSLSHIRQVMAEYEQLKGTSLERAVKAEFSGYTEKAMVAILQCAQSTAGYFAYRLHGALAGAGTNDRALIRVLVSRCDIDLGSIKMAFERAYGRSLQSFVSGDTSGDYKKALLTLVG